MDFLLNIDERILFGSLLFIIYISPKIISKMNEIRNNKKIKLKHTKDKKKLFNTKERDKKSNFYDDIWEQIK